MCSSRIAFERKELDFTLSRNNFMLFYFDAIEVLMSYIFTGSLTFDFKLWYIVCKKIG